MADDSLFTSADSEVKMTIVCHLALIMVTQNRSQATGQKQPDAIQASEQVKSKCDTCKGLVKPLWRQLPHFAVC